MASDVFLKIDDIEGESDDDKHPNEIELLSWGWGASQSAAGRGAGRVEMSDFQFVMEACVASPALMFACAMGKVIPEVVLTCRRAHDEKREYLVITMSNGYVTSYNTSGAEGVPIDSISLSFEKISYAYTSPSDTNVVKGWDLVSNVPI